ncbi:MAG TPA: GIY-YIG nuclease family protein [Tahibacter sp.]|nr:GIY-YIG nuclease family protein [Tahibacter sp.]
MTAIDDESTAHDDLPRDPGVGPSRGTAFVYVLPCRYEDILKVGFSRDPLDRFRTLHARWFEFFDPDAALLVETDRVADARRLETALGDAVALHSAPAPLVVPRVASGHTEWYRGAYAVLADMVDTLRDRDGYVVHRPAATWLAHALERRAAALYAWSAMQLEAIRMFEHGPSHDAALALGRALRDALDAYDALGLPPERWIGEDVRRWYRG